uniref:Uncharacterized protein n=1 Tax=Alexandrium catenella TaxID=2925 RepID=A0A7S1QCB6_ALECA
MEESAADAAATVAHYQQAAWQQRIGEESRTAVRFHRWQRGERHAFEEHQVAPLCVFRRTASQPTFVRLLEGDEGRLPPHTRASLPRAAASPSRGACRTPTPWPCASPAASLPRSSSSASSRPGRSRGQAQSPLAPTRSVYQSLKSGRQEDLAVALEQYAAEERRLVRETRRKLQASWAKEIIA